VLLILLIRAVKCPAATNYWDSTRTETRKRERETGRELYEFAVKRFNKLSPRKKDRRSSETGLREISRIIAKISQSSVSLAESIGVTIFGSIQKPASRSQKARIHQAKTIWNSMYRQNVLAARQQIATVDRK